MSNPDQQQPKPSAKPEPAPTPGADAATPHEEIGGQAGPEPTRFGDWEKAGRCTDF